MNISKQDLSDNFKKKNWDYVFNSAYKITDYLCSKVYKMTDQNEREDVVQECMLNLHKKIIQNKVDENNNIFSFIYTNSNYRILEIIRKERNRKKKVSFVSYDELEECGDLVDFIASKSLELKEVV